MPRPTPPQSARNRSAFTYDIERLALAAWLIHYRRTLRNPQWDLRFRMTTFDHGVSNRYPPLDPSGPQTEAPYQIYLPPPAAGAATVTVVGVNTMDAWNHTNTNTPWYDVMEAWLVPPGTTGILDGNLTPEQRVQAQDPNLNNPAFLRAHPSQTPQFLQIERNPNEDQDILDDPDTEIPDVTPTGWQWFQPDAMIAHQGIVRNEHWNRNWAFAPAFAAIQVIQAGVPNAQPFWVPIEDLEVYEYNPTTQQLNGLPLFNGTTEDLAAGDMQAANLPPGWGPLFTNENPFNTTVMQTFAEFDLQATDHAEGHIQSEQSPLTHLAENWAQQHPGSPPSANPFILDPALDHLQDIEEWFTRFLANPATAGLPVNLMFGRIPLLLPNFTRPPGMGGGGGSSGGGSTASGSTSIARRWGPASIDRAGTAKQLNSSLIQRHCFQPSSSSEEEEEEEEEEEDEEEDGSWFASSFTEPPDDTGGSGGGGPPPSGGGGGGGSSTGGQQGGSTTGGGEEPGSGASGQGDREQDREENPRDQKDNANMTATTLI